MLKELHRQHLVGGTPATAHTIRRFAVELGSTTDAIIRGVRVAATSTEPEVAGWATAVSLYVDRALHASRSEASELLEDGSTLTDPTTR
jgi:hypothetical protein